MKYDSRRALELLRIGCGNPAATFREGQEEAIQHVVEGKGRLLVIQKTGWGKSFVYFIATKLLSWRVPSSPGDSSSILGQAEVG